MSERYEELKKQQAELGIDRPWELLPPEGAINPRTGEPYKMTQQARWNMIVAQNEPLLLALRSIIHRLINNRPEVLEAIRRGVLAANERDDVIERRLAATELLKGLPRDLSPKQAEKARLSFYSRGLTKLDDVGGKVYVMRRRDQPDGPFKIGSSFDPSIRRQQLEQNGYYSFYPSGCELELLREFGGFGDVPFYFRRAEMKAHEMLGMDAAHKMKFGELCFLPLPPIISIIRAAIQLVAEEVAEEERQRKIEEEARAEHGPRRNPLFNDFGTFAEVVSRSPQEFQEKFAALSVADDYAWMMAESVFGESQECARDLSDDARFFYQSLSQRLTVALLKSPNLSILALDDENLTKAKIRTSIRKEIALLVRELRGVRMLVPKAMRWRLDQTGKSARDTRSITETAAKVYTDWHRGDFPRPKGDIDHSSPLPEWAIWRSAKRVEFSGDDKWEKMGAYHVLGLRVRQGLRAHVSFGHSAQDSSKYILAITCGRPDHPMGYTIVDRALAWEVSSFAFVDQHIDLIRGWTRDLTVAMQCGRVPPPPPAELGSVKAEDDSAGPPFQPWDPSYHRNPFATMVAWGLGGLHSRDAGPDAGRLIKMLTTKGEMALANLKSAGELPGNKAFKLATEAEREAIMEGLSDKINMPDLFRATIDEAELTEEARRRLLDSIDRAKSRTPEELRQSAELLRRGLAATAPEISEPNAE